MKIKRDTTALKRMIADLRKMNGGKLEWGFFDEDTYDNPRGEASVAAVAMMVEEGHDNDGLFPGTSTPPRPFFSSAVNDAENIRQVRAAIKHLQRKVLQGKISPDEKMAQLSDVLTDQLKESILTFSGAPLQDSTLDMREWRGVDGDDPLIESGTLLESVKAKVNGRDVDE